MRDIGKPYPLLSTRDVFIILLEQRHQLIDKGTALLKELFASLSHLLLPELHEKRIESCWGNLSGAGLFQQGVALLQGIIVVAQGINIRAVVLGNNHIHQFATLLASTLDKQRIGRRHDDERYQSDVLRQPFILFFIALEMLLLPSFHTHGDD